MYTLPARHLKWIKHAWMRFATEVTGNPSDAKIITRMLSLNKLKGGLLHNNFTMQLITFEKMNLVISSLVAEMLSDNVRGAHK